jgi:hypothetical protein
VPSSLRQKTGFVVFHPANPTRTRPNGRPRLCTRLEPM